MMKTVIITGGSSGIGLGIAREFSLKGYRCCIAGLEPNGDEIAATLQKETNFPVHFFPIDVSNFEKVKEMMEDIALKYQIDVLINNAGIQHVSPVEEFPVDKWKKILDVNLSGAFYCCREVFSTMKRKQFGRIINIVSAHGLVASEFKSAYVSAKHGMIGLTKVLALEGAPFGITANAICPGYVKTPLVEKQIADTALAHGLSPERVEAEIMLVKQPVKRFVDIATLAAMALLLASEGSESITGATWTADGGWTAQ
jgi:3-hydroxybutyrate dehydrogenase